jgi:hypothetical protein
MRSGFRFLLKTPPFRFLSNDGYMEVDHEVHRFVRQAPITPKMFSPRRDRILSVMPPDVPPML